MVKIGALGVNIFNYYTVIISSLPLFAQKFVGLFLIVLLIFLYSIFIWKLYRFISKKNFIELNLNQYNTSEHPLLAKTLAMFFYVIEYFLVLPFLIFIWFSMFTLFLIFLTDNLEIGALLIISAAIIAAIRMASYYHEDLSRDLAKLFPFTLLAISILNPNFFSIERVLNQFKEIPAFFNEILIYLIFIISLETILRFVDFIFSFYKLDENIDKEDSKDKEN